jgi:hypothetical protein
MSEVNDFIDLSAIKAEEPVDARGALVFYIDVGALPPPAAEAFIDKMRSQFFKNQSPRIPKDIATFFIPVRNQETLVDFVPFAVTEEELLEDAAEIEEVGEDFVHDLYVGPRQCCGGNKVCCKEEAPVGWLKGLCKKIFGSKCCS